MVDEPTLRFVFFGDFFLLHINKTNSTADRHECNFLVAIGDLSTKFRVFR